MHAVEAKDLRRTFVRKKGKPFRKKKKEILKAVDGVTFHIDRGEIFSLLGPNGAGKTTIIKMLATLLIPTSGTALVGGYDVVKDDGEVRKRLTAVLPGERTLYWKLSVRENLHYFSSLYGMPRAEARERIEQLLHDFEMADKRDDLVEKLSTGQRQKIVLCRALLPRPDVLLLDEPTLGLDPVSAKNLRTLVKKISSEGTSILLTTHYMYEADDLSDRVAIIHEGKITCMDTPEVLKKTVDAKRIFRFSANRWDNAVSQAFRRERPAREIRYSRRNGHIVVELESREEEFGIAELSSFCALQGIQIHTVKVDEPSLEDVFIEQTGSHLDEEGNTDDAPLHP